MPRQYPFLKIRTVSERKHGGTFFLAASGPSILSLSLTEAGKLLSRWPALDDDDDASSVSSQEDHQRSNGSQRPSKRRKLDPTQPEAFSREGSEASEASVEIVAERKKGERRRPKVISEILPNVSHLITTSDGAHAIAVTAEDKAVRVFEIRSSGRLRLLSSRSLPKRLCAVQLTHDEKTILSADKFGDVYSIPLHPRPDWIPNVKLDEARVSFTPSASEFTVHTKGNLEALRQQRVLKNFQAKKEGPSFEHQLLLGHVSLLTDLTVARGSVAGHQRSFILTADRDEHIRVSRGIPQAHIIEAYCLGHTEFISKLCIIPWAPDLLVAGNGEPSLRLYKWQTGMLLQQHLLSSLLDRPETGGEEKSSKLVVSGIWPITISEQSKLAQKQSFRGVLLVGYEGVPLVDTFCLDGDSQLRHITTTTFSRNVLDITPIGSDNTILVSLDTFHEASSTKTPSSSNDVNPLIAMRLAGTGSSESLADIITDGEPILQWELVHNFIDREHAQGLLSQMSDSVAGGSSRGKGDEKLYSNVGEFLYGLENLRKKRDGFLEDETGDAVETSNQDVAVDT